MPNEYDPTNELTRRQFFARLRKLGYKRSEFEWSRMSISYEKTINGRLLTITLPKHHTSVVQVVGPVEWSGWHTAKSYATWHYEVPQGWDLLNTIYGLASERVKYTSALNLQDSTACRVEERLYQRAIPGYAVYPSSCEQCDTENIRVQSFYGSMMCATCCEEEQDELPTELVEDLVLASDNELITVEG